MPLNAFYKAWRQIQEMKMIPSKSLWLKAQLPTDMGMQKCVLHEENIKVLR